MNDVPQPTKVYAPADDTEQALLLARWLAERRQWVGPHEVFDWELDPAWCETEVAGLSTLASPRRWPTSGGACK